MTETNWYPTDRYLPSEGQIVWTMDSGGTVQKLRYKDGLWFFPDMSMYVYYTPTLWKDVL